MGIEDILGQVLKSAGGAQGGTATGGDPLTSMLASAIGADKKDASPILVAIVQFVQANGGVLAVVEKFRKSGLGKQANSWVGTGANQPITPEQIDEVFDADSIAGLAKNLHTTPEKAKSTLADTLPELVNQFSPQGSVPDNEGDLLSMCCQMLQGK